MIKRITEISGVGKFDNYKCRGDVEMRSSTIIYAENGHGKTTLTNIIKSLATGTNDAIIKRKTVGATNQTINIQTDTSNHIFKNGKWQTSTSLPQVEVFDIFFVNENIYSGFEQSLNHGKNLYKFVIGEEAVKLANKIKDLKEEIANQNKSLTALGQSIQKETGQTDLKNFLKLNQIQDIDERIQENAKAIATAKQNETIIRTSSLEKLRSISLPFDSGQLVDLLSTNLETISNNFINKVENQKERLAQKGITNSGEWITQGFKTLNLDNEQNCDCPFCNQSLNNSTSLLEAYKQYFSDEYINLHAKVAALENQVSSFNISNLILSLQKTVTGNLQLLNFWGNHIPVSPNSFLIDFQSNEIESLLLNLKNLLIKKSSNVLSELDSDAVLDFNEAIISLNTLIQGYNLKIEEFNTKIVALKQDNHNLISLNEEADTLALNKRRFADLKDACEDYFAAQKAIEDNKSEKDKFQKALSDETERFFIQYGQVINGYITKLMPGANYQLQKLEGTYTGTSKEPAIQYTLTISGIPISASENNISPSFKYTLSEGDKTALAFAFFLSKLEMQDISNKVIVFDDPISSLDKQRRKRTLTAITDLNKRAKQVITLSHNENFIYDLYEHPNSSNPKVLRIVYGGKIEEFKDIEDEMQSDYFKSLKAFDEFIDDPKENKIKDIRSSIRIALENNLKFRFHKYLKEKHTRDDGTTVGPYTGKSGLGNLIDILEASDCVFRKDKKEILASLRELNSISMNDHHGTIDKDHRLEGMSIQELLGYIGDTLQLIYYKI